MSTMSHSNSSPSRSIAIEESCVEEKTGNYSADKSPKCESSDHSSPDKCLRERVLKEVGLTSTAFIGPAFPPKTSTAKCDIDDSLSKFYKELEKIDPPNQAKSNPERDDIQQSPEAPASKEAWDEPEGKHLITRTSAKTNSYQNNCERTKFSWPHWYQNEPYQLKQQRPASNQRAYPPSFNRPTHPRFFTPRFPHQPHQPSYPNPQNPPPYMSHTLERSGMTNQYYNKFPARPPPHRCLDPSQGFYGNPPPPFGWNDTDSDNGTVGWSRDRREERSWCHENYDRHQRYVSVNEHWRQQHHDQSHDNTHGFHSALVLILMRGLPGSGKTTLARELLSTAPSGVILSTDDYFAQTNGYRYDVELLGAAHEWNQNRAKYALQDGRSPIIIDNTNLQYWEMKPYVKMALERGYKVDFCEPDTSWKFDPYELEKRNKHGVPHEKIAQMMDRFSSPISIDIVMNSQEPAHVNQRRQAEQLQIRKTHFL
ncbi:NEDD4-binding protein 2-like 2 [Kryptolebias marmoratus]|uniref:NEDD4 binding protein 2-like 2 n=1 Tax=Kryptolebias marmoratus TaxID=37003 RepID=A0A3Q3F9T9_KRYMA|nr:NEDD4-binding protein 2-like 2 [Kryptolebias marmoratus]